MKSAAFELAVPGHVSEALALLADGSAYAKVLGGSQSLGPMLNLRLAQPERLVAVGRLPGMLTATREDNSLLLGAGVTHARIEDGEVPDVTNGLMPFVASNIAYRAIRNRGTLGGSLAHADPAADWVSTMLLVGATLRVATSTAAGADEAAITQRDIAMEDFMQGPFTTALSDQDILTGIRVPAFSASARWGYYKFCRKPGEFAEAIGGVLSDPERGIHRLLIGATDGVPLVFNNSQDLLSHADPAAMTRLLEDVGLGDDPGALKLHRIAACRAIDMLNQTK